MVLSTPLRTAIIVLGVAGLVAAAAFPNVRFAGLLVACVFLFMAATALSQAGRVAHAIQPLRGQTVEVRIWGAPLPAAGAFRVHSIHAFGAALLFQLEPAGGGKVGLLKVAQPRDVRHSGGRVEIGYARYVQWAGKKMAHADGIAAFQLVSVNPAPASS